MRHEKRRAVAAQTKIALQLKRANSLFGTANHIPSNQPFAERDMRVLKNCADCDGKFLVALRAAVKPGADFLGGIGLNFPNGFLIAVFAMRANRAIRPQKRFNIFAGGFIAGETLIDFIQRQIFWCWQQVRFHASNMPYQLTLVKCIIQEIILASSAGFC